MWLEEQSPETSFQNGLKWGEIRGLQVRGAILQPQCEGTVAGSRVTVKGQSWGSVKSISHRAKEKKKPCESLIFN